MLQASIDHFILGIGDLDKGITQFHLTTGVEPVFGGVHDRLNTHNALVSLDQNQYLEILSPLDNNGILDGPFGKRQMSDGLELLGWVIAINDLDLLIPVLDKYHMKHSGIQNLSRKTSEGKEIKWRNIFLIENDQFSINPFFIEWGDEVIHPSQITPSGCSLDSFKWRADINASKTQFLQEILIDLETLPSQSPNMVGDLLLNTAKNLCSW